MRSLRSAALAVAAAGAVASLAVGGAAPASVAASPSRPAADAVATARAVGDIRVFARIAKPGEPSLTLVTPRRRVYVGTFESVEATDTSPSKVFAYSRGGHLRRTWTVRGQTPGKAHGVQVAERDRRGRLYLLDQAPARVVRLDPSTGRQSTYATFTDVPTCSASHRTSHGVAQCSRTKVDNAPEPDYAAWLPDGSMLVTDYAQQLVWRVPPHGGRARVWTNDKRLDGEEFGPAGIVLLPDHHHLLLTVATGGVTTGVSNGDVSRGRLYRVSLGRHGSFGGLTQLWASARGDAPDGFAVARGAHRVYIAMAGPTANRMVEVARGRDGHWRSVWTVPTTPDGAGTSPVAWDTATSVQFLGSELLVTNQSYFTDIASHWVVFDVMTHDRGMRLFTPRHAG